MPNNVLRVLQVIGTMNYGGAETYLMNIYRNIDRSRLQFDFLVFGDEGAYDEEIKTLGGRIFYFKKRLYSNPIDYCRSIEDFFKNHREYKLVHSHLNDMSGFVVRGAKKAGVDFTVCHAHVSNPRTDTLHKIAWYFGRHMIGKYSDRIFGCSQAAVDYLSQYYKGKSSVINNAINIDKFKFDEQARADIRQELGISDDSLTMISVARFSAVKNHTFMVDLLDKTKKERTDSNLIFVGEGGLETQIREKAAAMGLSDSVYFVGTKSNVEQWLSAADVFLFPSLYEGLGIAAIEAQSNGLPCAISDTVPREADINAGLARFLPLDDLQEWKDYILSAKREYDHQRIKTAASDAGYDIVKVSKEISDFYIEKSRDDGK